ncbi:MAG: 5-(carboxyamino)imidazole ribonucleotide mutase [Gemmatimonadota bacterium]|nr:5-(carboxyamino)imidazole ribonucleotide mutase [Gemmatimonadota bacterium]
MKASVMIIMGSKSDMQVMCGAEDVLREAGKGFETHVSSAHRSPDKTRDLIAQASERGIRVIIAGAGMSAALPGFCASYTSLPVIGVPVSSGPLGGIDALLSIAQMPPGVPVATVAVNGAKNAAHLALRILGLIVD